MFKILLLIHYFDADYELFLKTHSDGYIKGSSLFYNTSVRDERHECNTNNTSATQVQHKWHQCNRSATRMLHKCDMSATRVRREYYTNETSATWVNNFYFDNDTSENTFSHPYISYMTNERLQGEEQFHCKNYLLAMPHSHAKMHLKITPQKLHFVMAKAISKSYTLDCSCKCSCTFPHSYA